MRIATALLWCLAAPALAGVPEPEGFRGEPYRAEVPATVMGRPGLSPEEAEALHAQGVPFLDVLPHAARPEGLPEGTVWREKPHLTIPGATWLPNTGYEALAEPDAAYLRQGLERATGAIPRLTWWFSASGSAGCPGTSRNARWNGAIRAFTGSLAGSRHGRIWEGIWRRFTRRRGDPRGSRSKGGKGCV